MNFQREEMRGRRSPRPSPAVLSEVNATTIKAEPPACCCPSEMLLRGEHEPSCLWLAWAKEQLHASSQTEVVSTQPVKVDLAWWSDHET